MQSNDDIASNGIRILEMAVTYPVDTSTIKEFAHGLSELIIIEEKQPIVETAVRDILSGAANSPRIIGKSVHHANPIAPHHGTLDTGTITTALRTRLSERLGDRLAPAAPQQIHHIELTVERSPFFCSGCPHNSSTVVPEGSVVGAGIGCHTMVMLGEPGRGGDIVGVTAMGNEGSLWIGMEDFVSTDHMIQNIGDGTYFHSGQLAITSAVAAGSHMTFKLLYNGPPRLPPIFSARELLVSSSPPTTPTGITTGQPRLTYGIALASSKHKKCLRQPRASPCSSTISHVPRSSGAIANADVPSPRPIAS